MSAVGPEAALRCEMDGKELERPIVPSKRGNGPYRAPWSEGGAALWAQRWNHAEGIEPPSVSPQGNGSCEGQRHNVTSRMPLTGTSGSVGGPGCATTQGGPTSLKSRSDPGPTESKPDRIGDLSPDVEAIDAIIQSVWGEERCSASRERLFNTERPSASSHDVLPPVRLIDSLSPRSLPLNRIQFSSDRRNRAGLPLCFEKGNDEPDLTLTSLIAATVATEWLLAWRWDRTRRSGRSGASMDSGVPVAPFQGGARGSRLNTQGVALG